MEFLEDAQRDDVNDKVQLLLKNSYDLNKFLSTRIPIIELYLRFHQEADLLRNLFNNLEQTLKTQKHSEDFHYIDTVWIKIQSQFTLLQNVAKLFATEKEKVCGSRAGRGWLKTFPVGLWGSYPNCWKFNDSKFKRDHAILCRV